MEYKILVLNITKRSMFWRALGLSYLLTPITFILGLILIYKSRGYASRVSFFGKCDLSLHESYLLFSSADSKLSVKIPWQNAKKISYSPYQMNLQVRLKPTLKVSLIELDKDSTEALHSDLKSESNQFDFALAR